MPEKDYELHARVAVLENEMSHLKAAHGQQAQHYAGLVEGLRQDHLERWDEFHEWQKDFLEPSLKALQTAVGINTDATKTQKIFFFAVLAIFTGVGWLVSQIASILSIGDKFVK